MGKSQLACSKREATLVFNSFVQVSHFNARNTKGICESRPLERRLEHLRLLRPLRLIAGSATSKTKSYLTLRVAVFRVLLRATMAKVCVTGASGFIASWLVKLLLERGYTVRASVRDPNNVAKTAHLTSLPKANERLELFKADLLEDGSFDSAVDGCDGVFHTASPFFFNTTNPQEDLIGPALKGTVNVLNACAKAKSVKRVVLTSSTAAVIYNTSRKPEDVVDETFWSDQEYCRSKNFWYQLSKTMAEMEAWKLSKEHGLDLVTINPAMVVGSLLQPTMNTSSETILKCLNGSASTFPNATLGWVHVKDVAEAHILAYEVPTASGRYICVERIAHYEEIIEILHKLYPDHPVPKKCADETGPRAALYKINAEKVGSLGLKYTPIEEAIKECVESLIERKLVKGNP